MIDRNAIAEENMTFAIGSARRWSNRSIFHGFIRDEAPGIAGMALDQAIREWSITNDEYDRAPFRVYLYRFVVRRLADAMRKEFGAFGCKVRLMNAINVGSLPEREEPQAPEQAHELDWRDNYEFLRSKASQRYHAVLDAVFLDSMSLAEAGKLFGITSTGVHRRLEAALKEIRSVLGVGPPEFRVYRRRGTVHPVKVIA